MQRKPNFLKALVIVHGKSEKQMCEYIKTNLKLKMEIFSDKNGEKAIQITSVLKRTLNNSLFKTINGFKKNYEDLEIDPLTKKIKDTFKIFIIMDTDDCTSQQKERYINKTMFREHWAYEYIVPIWDTPNLEEVLIKSGIKFEKEGRKQKKEYIKIFPTDKKYIKSDTIQLKDFYNQLEDNSTTNLDVFIKFCLEQIK